MWGYLQVPRSYVALKSGQNPEVASFVARACGGGSNHNWGNHNTLSFYDSRGLKVGLVYNHFHWPNIAIHVAAREGALWCTKEILHHIFAYPFLQLQCNRVTAPVVESNARSIALVEALGFVREGEMRHATKAGESMLIYGMLRDECRWTKAQELRKAA